MFAEGLHPSYPNVFMDGRDGITDIRLSAPSSTGAFIRYVSLPPCIRRRKLSYRSLVF
jgi:hypothetical protein